MKKKFDAVKFQRKVCEELSEKYSSNREAFLRELKEKYGNLQKRKAGTHIRYARDVICPGAKGFES
ncbi:hypothetical protein M1M90_02335 [Thermodesulfovibrionales bacterium]|nr:hypothetical protein [Thermodesulfovibrionales bacterium]